MELMEFLSDMHLMMLFHSLSLLEEISFGTQLDLVRIHSLFPSYEFIWISIVLISTLVKEGIFVGGEASLPSSLNQQLTARCDASGCLNSGFDSLANFWNQISSYAASQASNVGISIANNGTATLSCSGSPSFYVVNCDSTDFNNASIILII